jgi:hypothetical protein
VTEAKRLHIKLNIPISSPSSIIHKVMSSTSSPHASSILPIQSMKKPNIGIPLPINREFDLTTIPRDDEEETK